MKNIEKVCRLLRYYILTSTTKAGSGHVTSSLSAVELTAILYCKYFRFDLDNPEFVNNDRLIFSKGHASPLFYALYAVAGKVTEEEMMTFRKFDSVLEGHPTKRFEYTEVPTGSLGQGLSAGVGMALSARIDNLNFLTYVLLGDGEIAEGQVWEALNIASHYKLNNLVGIIDVNRLGQSGETITAYNLKQIEERVKSFGWRTYVVNDGHNLDEIEKAYLFIISELPKGNSPYMIIAKTVKGKGVSFLQDKEGWHGKALSNDECKKALLELGDVDTSMVIEINKPESTFPKSKIQMTNYKSNSNLQIIKKKSIYHIPSTIYKVGDLVATREAYGKALADLGKLYEDMVVLDGDVSNSTFSYLFKEAYPDRYFEMFIAEQNMVSAGLGMSERGKVPYISTFAAFLERAADQIRIANLSGNHLVLCGSHGGVSIGEDGPSQMGLEDLSFFRSLLDTTVFYPSDAVSSHKLTELAYKQKGLVYIRNTRSRLPVIYDNSENYEVGGSKTLKRSDRDKVTLIAAGVTVHEVLKAYEELEKDGINTRIIDAYSIKPIDVKTILKSSKETEAIVTVEDHYITGGLGDAVLDVLAENKSIPVYKMGVTKVPRSGKPEQLLEYEGIDARAIINKVIKLVKVQ